jgi:hypothetical protein
LHRYKTALATSSQSDRRALSGAGRPLDSFDVIVCRDDIAVPKPAPDIYLKAAERLGVSPKTALRWRIRQAGALRVSRGMRVVMIPDWLLRMRNRSISLWAGCRAYGRDLTAKRLRTGSVNDPRGFVS